MNIKLFGINIYFSFLFFSILTVVILIDTTGFIIPTVLAICFHEIGHLIAMKIYSIPPKEIRLIPGTVQIIKPFCLENKKEVIILLAGPAVNLIIFLAIFINYCIFQEDTLFEFGMINLFFFLFNMMPLYGLDGGTILFLIISKYKTISFAEKILKAVTFFFSFLFVFLGLYMFFYMKSNLSFVIMGIYFFIAALMKL